MASKSRANTASSSPRPSRPALTAAAHRPHIEILRGERAHSFLDSPDGCAEMLRSHQLARVLTTSAMQRMASEMPGRLNAPKMLGRRGTSSTV